MSTATSPSRSSAGHRTRWLCVGDVRESRAAAFRAAAADAGVRCEFSGWEDVATGRTSIPPAATVRLDSPGRGVDARAFLHRLGGGLDRSTEWWAGRATEIVDPAAWYRGVCRAAASIAERCSAVGAVLLQQPDHLAICFDKRATHRRLAAAAIPVPEALPDIGSAAALRAAMTAQRRGRVFVKLAHGSAASGAVALRLAGDRVRAWTTVDLADGRLHNTRRVRQLSTWEDVVAVVDALAPHGLHVEAWVPRVSVRDRVSDWRVWTVGGEPSHAVARCSRTPFTNLHLRNVRVAAEEARASLPSGAWEAAMRACRQVGERFSGLQHVGVDLAFSPGRGRAYVLEVNVFGDWLKGVVRDGRTTHAVQLAAAHRNDRP